MKTVSCRKTSLSERKEHFLASKSIIKNLFEEFGIFFGVNEKKREKYVTKTSTNRCAQESVFQGGKRRICFEGISLCNLCGRLGAYTL